MAQEDKSVRKLVQEIEARTGKLDAAIEKLSDSLNRISESLAKPKEDGPGREELIQKFKQPFATPEAVKSESNSEELLDQIKDALVFNQKDNFSLFKSIDTTLKKIEEKGVSLGGADLKLGRGAPKAVADTKKTQAKAAAADAGGKKAAGGTLSKVGGALAKGARFIPGVGIAVAGGMAAMDAVSGASEAEKVLDIKDREATPGERLSAGAGGLVEGLTFGLMSRERAAKGIESARQGVMGLFSGGDKEPVSTAGSVASANVGGVTPDFKYIEEQRKKREAKQTTYIQPSVKPTPKIEPIQPSVKPTPKIEPIVTGSSVTPISTVTGETNTPTSNLRAAEAEASPLGALQFLKSLGILPKGQGGKDGFVGYKDDQPISKDEVAKKITAAGKDPNKVLQLLSEMGKPGDKIDVSSGDFNKTTGGAFSLPAPSTQPSQTVNQMSQENADMKEGGQAVQPVVINNSSSVATNTQTFTPLRASARPNNNSFERKQNMAASY